MLIPQRLWHFVVGSCRSCHSFVSLITLGEKYTMNTTSDTNKNSCMAFPGRMWMNIFYSLPNKASMRYQWKLPMGSFVNQRVCWGSLQVLELLFIRHIPQKPTQSNSENPNFWCILRNLKTDPLKSSLSPAIVDACIKPRGGTLWSWSLSKHLSSPKFDQLADSHEDPFFLQRECLLKGGKKYPTAVQPVNNGMTF